jgi:hypothetical protein
MGNQSDCKMLRHSTENFPYFNGLGRETEKFLIHFEYDSALARRPASLTEAKLPANNRPGHQHMKKRRFQG